MSPQYTPVYLPKRLFATHSGLETKCMPFGLVAGKTKAQAQPSMRACRIIQGFRSNFRGPHNKD